MDIILFSEQDNSELRIHDEYILNNSLWNGYNREFSFRSAYLDIIFNADDQGQLRTTISSLSERWNVKPEVVMKWLHKLKNHKAITIAHDRFYWYITLLEQICC